MDININGTLFQNQNTVKVFNLSNELKLNYEIYIQSSNQTALEWILGTNGDGSARLRLLLEGIHPYEIKAGNLGDKFSNPIRHDRESSDGNNVSKTFPSLENPLAGPYYFYSGSNSSGLGEEWSKFLMPQYVDSDTREIKSTNNGEEIKFLNYDTDDHFTIIVERTALTDSTLFDLYIKDIIFIVEPSIREQFEDSYQYFISEETAPVLIEIGVTY